MYLSFTIWFVYVSVYVRCWIIYGRQVINLTARMCVRKYGRKEWIRRTINKLNNVCVCVRVCDCSPPTRTAIHLWSPESFDHNQYCQIFEYTNTIYVCVSFPCDSDRCVTVIPDSNMNSIFVHIAFQLTYISTPFAELHREMGTRKYDDSSTTIRQTSSSESISIWCGNHTWTKRTPEPKKKQPYHASDMAQHECRVVTRAHNQRQSTTSVCVCVRFDVHTCASRFKTKDYRAGKMPECANASRSTECMTNAMRTRDACNAWPNDWFITRWDLRDCTDCVGRFWLSNQIRTDQRKWYTTTSVPATTTSFVSDRWRLLAFWNVRWSWKWGRRKGCYFWDAITNFLLNLKMNMNWRRTNYLSISKLFTLTCKTTKTPLRTSHNETHISYQMPDGCASSEATQPRASVLWLKNYSRSNRAWVCHVRWSIEILLRHWAAYSTASSDVIISWNNLITHTNERVFFV